ncbi:hypothetical protein J2125_001454 [Erwinia toletana]|uniref:Uncharacterized protein n=1 Tax=Winslowiella toletana TaxID=92490 RepID=A0ABS4P7X4_9GAMM|nr:Imm8 family immunity protein [Winslowiella toletana]MBP2168262.1 hypothetical protein [Winslowiella toletana]
MRWAVRLSPAKLGSTLCKHHWLPELMRHTLLVRKYDLDEITKTITNYTDQCEDKDWMEIAQKIFRVFAWEYEDYQPYTTNPDD